MFKVRLQVLIMCQKKEIKLDPINKFTDCHQEIQIREGG